MRCIGNACSAYPLQYPGKQEAKNRQPRTPGATVKAPPKKKGAGGSYTWGHAMDVIDYEPVGGAGEPKVTTAPVKPQSDVPRAISANALGVRLNSECQFPFLHAVRTTNATKLAEAKPEADREMATVGARHAKMTAKSEAKASEKRMHGIGFIPTARATLVGAIEYVKEATHSLASTVTARCSRCVDVARTSICSTRQAGTTLRASLKTQGFRASVHDVARAARGVAATAVRLTRQELREAVGRVVDATDMAAAKAADIATTAREVASDKTVQTCAASSAGGALALGTSGGVVGFAAGSAFGAAIGLVPALFTLGLSIPIGATIGGGAGFVAGATAGTAIGSLGGGAAAYGYCTKQEQFREVASQTFAKVRGSAEYAREKASGFRFRRLFGGGTGSTED
mmetsp:Transcript_96127/g.271801  ORF Transcript_96127/g.271801 Transcript_96127/m.271801 type:complete len:399 (+) Transcript_96127:37-1233(+)